MTPKKEILCKDCANREIQFVLRGHDYVQELTCDYRMIAFPRASSCHKYTPDIDTEEEPN